MVTPIIPRDARGRFLPVTEGQIGTVTDHLAALPDWALARVSRSMADTCERMRLHGAAALAEWHDALGQLVDQERARRRGMLGALNDPTAVLVEAASGLDNDDIAMLVESTRDLHESVSAPELRRWHGYQLDVLTALYWAQRTVRGIPHLPAPS